MGILSEDNSERAVFCMVGFSAIFPSFPQFFFQVFPLYSPGTVTEVFPNRSLCLSWFITLGHAGPSSVATDAFHHFLEDHVLLVSFHAVDSPSWSLFFATFLSSFLNFRVSKAQFYTVLLIIHVLMLSTWCLQPRLFLEPHIHLLTPISTVFIDTLYCQ